MRFLRRWWHRLRGWWVLATAAAAAAVLSAVAQVYTSLAAGALCAVGLAVAGVVSERGRAQLGARPRDRGLLVTKVDRLSDPLRLGVHRAPVLDGNQVPPFVARDLLPDLVEALGKGGFVLVVGDSTAGKTRLAYEAMRQCLPRHVCVCPDGPDTLRAALDVAKVNRPSVLWLDDMDRYLGVGGLTRADLTDLNTLVLATMRTQERERLSHRHDPARDQHDRSLARAGRELLDVVTTEIHLERMWSGQELAAAAQTADPRIARAVVAADRHGIAEQLAAGPDLVRELRDAWDTRTRGAALVTAAVDLRRAGYDRPVPATVLRDLHESYLKPGTRPETWDAALTWATQPLHATSSLLEPVGEGYLAFDYLLDRAGPVPDAVWDAIVEFASSFELLEVAPEAASHGNHRYLRAALVKALAHKDATVAVILSAYVGPGISAEAAEREDLIRVRVSQLWWIGEVVAGRGDSDRGSVTEKLVQDSAGQPGDLAAETHLTRLKVVGDQPDLNHDFILWARLEEAIWARRTVGPRAAVRSYYDLLERAETAAKNGDSFLRAVAQWNLGTSLLEAGEAQSAVEVLEVAIENALLLFDADHDATIELRLNHIEALDGAGRVDDALRLAEQLAQDAERVLGPDHPTATDARFAVDQLTTRQA